MGVLIVADKPPKTGPYDKWKVYRADTQSGNYVEQVAQLVADLTYYDETGTSAHWYKISYYDTDGPSESALSDPIQGQSTTYTTVGEVEGLLQMPEHSDSTSPTVQEIVKIINRVEDKIDKNTAHAWRLRYSNTISGQDTTAQYEYYDVDKVHEYHTGRPTYLKHRKIKQLDSGEGDALEYWNGSEWEDWLSDRTEGRADDFWVDYDQGVVYIRWRNAVKKPKGLRIKYRYGETFVEGGINDIATKMVAMDVLTGMDPRAMIVQEGGVMTHDARVGRWRRETEENIQQYKEFQTMQTTL